MSRPSECPFCGGSVGIERNPTNPPRNFQVICKCPAFRSHANEATAINAWNTRITDRRALEHRICKQYQERFREWFRCSLDSTLMDLQARTFLESFIKDLPVEYVDDADAAANAQQIEWNRDPSASGWRSRAFLADGWQLIVYDEGDWSVCKHNKQLIEGTEASAAAGKARAIKVHGALTT